MTPITFEKLIETIESLDYNTGIYGDVEAWGERPMQEPLYLATMDDESEPDFDIKLGEAGLHEFFQLPTLQDIVRVERKKRPAATAEDMVAAAKHYRQFDDFRA